VGEPLLDGHGAAWPAFDAGDLMRAAGADLFDEVAEADGQDVVGDAALLAFDANSTRVTSTPSL